MFPQLVEDKMPTLDISPAAMLLRDITRVNSLMQALISEEVHSLNLCISFWESRKVRGWRWPFYICHNLHCQFRADEYRAKLKKHMEAINGKTTAA